jgi:3-keto-L-gulonate-6-phosphate decarboxylase
MHAQRFVHIYLAADSAVISGVMRMTTISALVHKLNELESEMQGELSDDAMDALVERAGLVEDQILVAKCLSMEDFLAKRSLAVAWTSLAASRHRHEVAMFDRLADDLIDVRRREMMALLPG